MRNNAFLLVIVMVIPTLAKATTLARAELLLGSSSVRVEQETEIARYVGHYALDSGATFEITLSGEHLFLGRPGHPVYVDGQSTGDDKVELTETAKQEFTADRIKARLTFQLDDRGNVRGLVLKIGNQPETTARKSAK